MDVAKTIRVLGYIVYVTLWSPVIVLGLIILPVVWMVIFMRSGLTAKEAATLYLTSIKSSIKHDMGFIRTGIW